MPTTDKGKQTRRAGTPPPPSPSLSLIKLPTGRLRCSASPAPGDRIKKNANTLSLYIPKTRIVHHDPVVRVIATQVMSAGNDVNEDETDTEPDTDTDTRARVKSPPPTPPRHRRTRSRRITGTDLSSLSNDDTSTSTSTKTPRKVHPRGRVRLTPPKATPKTPSPKAPIPKTPTSPPPPPSPPARMLTGLASALEVFRQVAQDSDDVDGVVRAAAKTVEMLFGADLAASLHHAFRAHADQDRSLPTQGQIRDTVALVKVLIRSTIMGVAAEMLPSPADPAAAYADAAGGAGALADLPDLHANVGAWWTAQRDKLVATVAAHEPTLGRAAAQDCLFLAGFVWAADEVVAHIEGVTGKVPKTLAVNQLKVAIIEIGDGIITTVWPEK